MSDIGTGLSPQPFDLFAMDGDENPSLAVPPQPPLDPTLVDDELSNPRARLPVLLALFARIERRELRFAS